MKVQKDPVKKDPVKKESAQSIGYWLSQLDGDKTAVELIEYIKNTPKPNLLAIIGSRKAEALSIKWTKKIAKEAVNRGFVVISGGARGIDQQAHLEAVVQGGQSMAIIACGLDKINRDLVNLANHGVGLASPFLAPYPPQIWTYPLRNKYIAELCDGLVVIQAAESSGSLLTARHALALGKKVWVVPHHPSQHSFRGSLQLLKEGAKPLCSPQSWFEDFEDEIGNNRFHPTHSSHQQKVELKQHKSPLWQVSGEQAKSIEILAADAALSYTEALLEATQLELGGWLTFVVGIGYKRAYP